MSLVVLSLSYIFNCYIDEEEEKTERKKERKTTNKKLKLRAVSSENVVIVLCSQIAMDCQEKPESSKKADKER